MANWAKWAIAGTVSLLIVGYLYSTYFMPTQQEREMKVLTEELERIQEKNK